LSDDIEIKITVDADGAIRVTNELGEEIEGAGKRAQGAEGGITKFQGSVIALEAAVNLGMKAFTGLRSIGEGLAGTLVDLAARGEMVGSLRNGFEELGGSASAIDAAREASIGLISEVDLLRIANQGLTAGIPDLNENFGKIADAGARLGNILGKDVTATTEQLTNAIARGRTTQLQQLGIIIDQDKAWADYAKTLGLVTEDLSTLQKQQAIQQASLKELNRFLDETSQVGDSVTNALDSLKNTMDNLKGEVGETVNQNEKLTKAFRNIESALDDIDVKDLANDIASLAAVLVNLGSNSIPIAISAIKELNETVKASTFIFKNLDLAAQDVGRNFLRGLGDIAPGLGKIMRNLGLDLDNNAIALKRLEGVIPGIRGLFGSFAGVIKTTAEEVEELTGETDDAEESFGKLTAAQKEALKIAAQLAKETEEQAKKFRELSQSVDDIIGISPRAQGLKQLNEDFKLLFEGQNRAAIATEDFAAKVRDLQADFLATGGTMEDFVKGLQDAASGLEDSGKKAAVSFGNGFFSVIGGGILQDKDRAQSFANFLGLEGDAAADTATALGAQIGNALDQGLALFLDAGSRGVEYAAKGSAIGALLGSIVGAYLGDPATGAAVGAAAGSIIGTLVAKLTGATQNKQALARREIESFINEMLDVNKMTINGIDFDRLILPSKSDFGSPKGEKGAFDQMVADMQAEQPELAMFFENFGGALGKSLGAGFAQGADIGFVLMATFGGSIDDLRLLVQLLELDIEDLKDGIIAAAKSGEISFLQAASALRDLPKAFEPGLDSAGEFETKWEKAFSNLTKSAGSFGSAYKAMNDLAFEAIAAGAETLEDLERMLIESGRFTEEQVRHFMALAREHGIDSVEGFMNLSEEAAIMFLGALEATGEFFEEIGKGLDEVGEKVDEIERRMDQLDGKQAMAELTINVRTRHMDNDSQAALREVDRQGAGQGA
jgi:methyl-accepting chemotaxis protein